MPIIGGPTPGANLPFRSVVDYGAVGNGVADDTAAINLAIASLNASFGGIVYLANPHLGQSASV